MSRCRVAHGRPSLCAGEVRWSGFCTDCYLEEFGEEQGGTCMHGHDAAHVPCDECFAAPDSSKDRENQLQMEVEHAYQVAYAAGHAAGYAESVEDVVAHVHASHAGWKALDAAAKGPRVHFVLGLLVWDLKERAHVGAAKKGST